MTAMTREWWDFMLAALRDKSEAKRTVAEMLDSMTDKPITINRTIKQGLLVINTKPVLGAKEVLQDLRRGGRTESAPTK